MSNYPEPIPLDERCEEGEEVISRKTIENSIDGENAETYRIVLDGQKVGGVVLQIDKEAAKGELELLFVLPECHSKGIGRALLDDSIKIGLSQGFTQIALVADAEMPHLINLYSSIGFVPADHRHAFGTDFLRMIYTV